MSVLARAELEESPLADLHALASELGIEGYRRLRREELIGAIVRTQGGDAAEGGDPAGKGDAAVEAPAEADEEAEEPPARRGRRGRGRSGRGRRSSREDEETDSEEGDEEAGEEHEVRAGVLDILPNGSGFVRADAFAHSPDDVYVSPAQIRRCELRTGDEVAGPVRSPRRSERYPSLVRVETVNGAPAEPPAERPSFADLTPGFARVRLAAPEELSRTPFGKGSRVAVAGPPGAGATTLLRRVVSTLAERHSEVETTVVLAGARPEEVAEWRAEVDAPVVGGSFDQSADRQGETATMAVERAKRVAERGGDAVVVVDSLELLPAGAARRVFGAARNTEEAGSVTVVAATGIGPEPARHATTRIVLRPPSDAAAIEVDADASGALRTELLS
jgi:transcription termination factor Rho